MYPEGFKLIEFQGSQTNCDQIVMKYVNYYN